MQRYIAEHKQYDLFEGGKHHGPKYNSNPVFTWLNNGFMDALLHFVEMTNQKKVFEIGCGEGQLIGMLYDRGYDVSGMDFDEEAVKLSTDNFEKLRGVGINITQGNLYDLSPSDEKIDGKLLICCEVLEHVEQPEKGVKIIADCAEDFFIVSVPNEPIWRILNFVRGKYIKNFGNTPGHINHWSTRKFINMVSIYADVVAYSTPLPWTMILARKKKK